MRNFLISLFIFSVIQPAVRADEIHENVVQSKFSIRSAFALIYPAMSGSGKAHVSDLFDFADDPIAQIKSTSEVQDRLQKTHNAGDNSLLISNRVFYKEGLEILPSYAKALSHIPNAQAPFSGAEEINAAIEKDTKGMIKNVLEKLSPDISLVLTNSIYLASKWQKSFEKKRRYKEPFALGDGSKVDVDMMHKNDTMNVAQSETWQAARMDYQGGNLAFLAIMPKDGTTVDDLKKAPKLFGDVLGSLRNAKVDLSFPKFDFSWKKDLTKEYQVEGLPVAVTNGGSEVIDQVIHAARIRVDEEGTEAAAVTVISETMCSMVSEREKYEFNRPFLFFIFDLESKEVLFEGQLANPLLR